MRVRTVIAVLFAILIMSPALALAQEQTGSIEGIVKDTQDKAVPGATVEAKSTGATLSTTSDSTGMYRFPALQSGIYEVSVKLTSFKPAKVGNVQVNVGSIKTVNFTLQVGQVSEQITVTAAPPVVDVKSSGRSMTVRSDEGLPSGRDFLSIVTRMPGTNNETKSSGIMIDGATASENRYVIDGVETSDLITGTSGKALIADFLEEVQVKSSGYTAEYGGSTGGVISAITKSGTNKYTGNALFNWQGSKAAGTVPSLRLDLTTASKGEYITYPKDTNNRVEPGFTIGGPIVHDKQWFWVAYQPAVTKIERTASPSTANNPNGTTITRTRKEQVQYLSANHTTQVAGRLHTRLAFNNSWSKVDGLLPSLAASDPLDSAAVNYLPVSRFPNWTLSGNADYTVSPNFLLGVRAGYYEADQHDSNVPNVSRYTWGTTSNVNFVGNNGVPVPANLQHPAGFTTVLSNFGTERDKQTRVNFQTDATWYGHMAGQHQIKGGVQVDRRANDVFSGEVSHRVTLRWGSTLGGQRGPFGYYSVRSAVDTRVDASRYGGAAAADALRKKGFTTVGDVHSNLVGLFVQDAWSVNDRLTLNLGVRTENEEVPIYGIVPGINAKPIKFGWKDKIAPRLGVAYDINGDGKTKVYGSWGIYYDIFKYELPRGSYGGDKWTEYYFTLDTPDFSTLNTGAGCPPACSGSPILSGGQPRIVDFRLPTYSLNPADCLAQGCTEQDLKPMKSQEVSVGFERELGKQLATQVRYVHKQIDQAIEDIGTLDAAGNEAYVIGNPGQGEATLAFVSSGLTVPLPKPKRDYDGVEFTVDKRFANNYFVRASYLWSRLFGNYPGLSQTDENGRTSPNVGRLYDYPIEMFQQNGKPVDGPLPTDRPHQLKVQFLYHFPFGTGVGINQVVASGIPLTAEIGVLPPNNFPMQWKNRGSEGRTDVLTQTDLSVQHSFKLGTRSVIVNANVLNLFNQQATVNKFITYNRVNGVNFSEAAFYAGQVNVDNLLPAVDKDPRFLMANGFQPPIQARFGVRFNF